MATTKTPRKARPAAKETAPAPVTTDNSRILFDSGATLIEHIHGDVPARWLVISFSPDDHRHVIGPGYYRQPLRKAGFDMLEVKQTSVAGYADLTPAIMAEVLGQLPRYEGAAVLSAETGAFAAICLLGSFEGLPILALSPRPIGSPGPAQAIRSDVYVAFDPKSDVDRAACDDVVTRFPRVQLLRMYSAGAPTRIALHEAGMIIPIIRGLVTGQPIDAVGHFRSNRNKSATILHHIATDAMNRRHMKTAQILLGRAVAISDQPHIAFTYSRALAMGGQAIRGIEVIDTLIAREPDNLSHYWAAKGHFQEIAGDDHAALESIRRAVHIEPDFEPFRVAERRLLDRLYDDISKRNQMTLAALEKARGELAMHRGFQENDEYDGRRMAALIAFSLGIVALVAVLAVIFRLI